MKSLHLISTDKPSTLHLWTDENGIRLEFCDLKYSHTRNTQHIYITSNEEIKEGYAYYPELNEVLLFDDKQGEVYEKGRQLKVILTTNQDLINDGIQAIDNEFLEWFIKNPSCEEVEIFIDTMGCVLENCNANPCINYKIIIPKEEQCTCKIGQPYNNACCKVHGSIPKEEPKQETLSNPVIIVRNDDKEKFIHLSNGMYRTEWGILNNSISTTPLKAFDKSKFTFYYE
jgi:hypothetical protein